MTNYEYIQKCNKYELAELITTLLVTAIEQYSHKPIEQSVIDLEIATMTD